MENIVNKLISCKKIITKNPRKEMYEDKQSSVILRNDFECTSEDRMYVFSVFMRKSKDMESLFSIGLKVEANFSSNGSRTPIGITILRCSGSHEHTNRIKNKDTFDDFHVHILEDQQYIQGQDKPVDAETTRAYNNFNTALYHFLERCNISGHEQFFLELSCSNKP